MKVRAIILGDSSLKEPVPSDRMGKAFIGLIKLIEENKTYQNIYKAMKKANPDDFDPVYVLIRAKNLSLLDPSLLKTIAESGLNLDSPGNHFYGYQPEEHLKKIKCPVLILQAEHGMLSNEEVQKALEILPEAYHVKQGLAPRVPLQTSRATTESIERLHRSNQRLAFFLTYSEIDFMSQILLGSINHSVDTPLYLARAPTIFISPLTNQTAIYREEGVLG